MQNSHRGGRGDGQQQQGTEAEAKREFKPVRLPAVAAAVQANKPALPAKASRRLPPFLRDEHESD